MSERQNKEIGKRLQEARLDQGLTIDYIQEKTKIQKRYLMAIEAGQMNDLPGDYYVKSFVSQYAAVVGLDSHKLLAGGLQASKEAETRTENFATGPLPSRTTQHTQVRKDSEFSRRYGKYMTYVPTIIVVVIVVAVLGTIWGMSHANNANQPHLSSSRVSVTNNASSSKKKQSSSEKASSSSSKSKTQKISQVGSSTTAYTLKNAPTSGSTLTFKAGTSNAWIAVSSDGTQSWSSTLQTGTSHTEKIAKTVSKVTITMGNAPQTTITVNGKNFDFNPQNDTTQTKTITLTIEN
ncbi:helix-turn-helix domain-containing protein [Pediococcus ethanolidurans]|uniref:helix-turn-helix domain-containing protein n=1 Tax=Pediococcus ethanolidurans TaxID=319653 RepID=UPI0021E9480C|nr:helix-turn-helix domain-containing protein [Pediococcus ethanolidurans]MCV3314468.1 helix-turn-helix domain-containing protein [Pediococcus ethanolidurans]MCV3326954.1 helix-turn-helix domain-containing protein [Pediococcus ethanolidurans]